MTFYPDALPDGTFEVTGDDGDLLCDSGRVEDTRQVWGGWQSGRGVQIQVRKDFICEDGSGTFFVKLQVHIEPDGTETFTWVVQGGTGSYEELHGSGSGSTANSSSTGNTNYYEGFLVG